MLDRPRWQGTLASRLFSFIKEQVYKDNISNVTHLKQKITEEFEKSKDDIRFISVQTSLIRRANLCVRDNVEDIFNNTCNSVLYRIIPIESSNEE